MPKLSDVEQTRLIVDGVELVLNDRQSRIRGVECWAVPGGGVMTRDQLTLRCAALGIPLPKPVKRFVINKEKRYARTSR